MEIQDSLVYVSMIITVGISMIILSYSEKFKNIFSVLKIKNLLLYFMLVFSITVLQWAFGGAVFFLYNKIY